MMPLKVQLGAVSVSVTKQVSTTSVVLKQVKWKTAPVELSGIQGRVLLLGITQVSLDTRRLHSKITGRTPPTTI